MVSTILKTTEIDIIWFTIYFGMFVGFFAMILVLYGTYLDLKSKDK
jgi:hypothetical protein